MNKRVRWEETGMDGMDDGFEDFGPGPNAGSAPKHSPAGAGGPWGTSMTNLCVTPTPVQRVHFRTCTTRNYVVHMVHPTPDTADQLNHHNN